MLTTERFSENTKQKGILGLIAIGAAAVVFGVLASTASAQEALSAPSLYTPLAGQEFSSPMPVISGKATSGDTVLVFIDDALNGQAKVRDSVFEYRPFLPLSSGGHAIRLQAKDASSGALSDFSDVRTVRIIPNPAPSILVPQQDALPGQDRVWVGGVARNGSLVRILVDGVEAGRTMVKNHASGTGSFSLNLSEKLSLGSHAVTAIARDGEGKESFTSESVSITVLLPTPAPILFRPVVNADSGIERPFVVGVAKNGLLVAIVVDGMLQQRIPLGADPSGAISFAWQPREPLSLGRHTIEAFASDHGKSSNNSKPVFWQVGEAAAASASRDPLAEPSASEEDTAPEPIAVRDDTELPAPPLTVRDELESPAAESPAIPDEPTPPAREPETPASAAEENAGRVEPEGGLVAIGEEDSVDDVTELGPGAVVRGTPGGEQGEFALNNSLIIGIIILVFLLLSILVWYIQEKRDALGERVVSMFRENDEGGKSGSDKLPGDLDVAERPKNDDLPPPPPPMF